MKPLLDFHKHQPSRGGRRAVCKKCLRRRRPRGAADVEKERRYRKTTQGRYVVWGKNLRSSYGIDQEDWARMYNAQNGYCAICKRHMNVNEEKLIHVDHEHASGKVRELLCKACNSLVGLAKENVETLLNAVEYLRRHR